MTSVMRKKFLQKVNRSQKNPSIAVQETGITWKNSNMKNGEIVKKWAWIGGTEDRPKTSVLRNSCG